MAEAWYVLNTKLRREDEALEEVRALGFECFLPVEIRRRKDRSKKHRPMVDYSVPMIPGYIFPLFDMSQPCGWQNLGRLHSVKGWLKSSQLENPRPMRDQTFIDRLKEEQIAVAAALNSDQSVKFETIPNGTRIVIQEGPFATLGGFVNMTVGNRVKVMLDAAGFSALEIARHSVAIAS